MATTSSHIAECRCGTVRVTCTGEPIRVSVCHCLACQRRTGSVFAAQARWPADRVTLQGETRDYVRRADSGAQVSYRFCPGCGSTVAYTIESEPAVIAVPMGAFADPGFQAPTLSYYESRKHRWVVLVGEGIEHYD